MAILYALDFDNTISHSTYHEGDIEIEKFKDKDGNIRHHYMSRIVYDFLKAEKEKGNLIVLVTARRRELFERIKMPVQPNLAITSYGGFIYRNKKPAPFIKAKPLPPREGYALEDGIFYRKLKRVAGKRKEYELPDQLGKDKVLIKLKKMYPNYSIVAVGDDQEYDGAMAKVADTSYIGKGEPDFLTHLLSKKEKEGK